MKKLTLLLALFAVNVLAEPVNINTADAETIATSLKGIGLKKAQDIVLYRKQNGAFNSADDLTQVKGIGAKTVQKNAQDIVLTSVPKKAQPTAPQKSQKPQPETQGSKK